MATNWPLVVDIAVPVGTLFLGAGVQRWFERRPKLQAHFGHVSAFRYRSGEGEQSYVHTHSVVLTNVGSTAARNVRIRHSYLPQFDIYPPVEHSVVELSNGSKEILVPTMVPKEQITINYLYFPPATYNDVNSGIRSDEGFAEEIPVLLQRRYPMPVNLLVTGLLGIGVISIIYLVIQGIHAAIA